MGAGPAAWSSGDEVRGPPLGPGAGLATLGIFLPAFVFVAASGPLVSWMRRSPVAAAILDGVNAASLALMAAVTWHRRSAIVDFATAALAMLGAILLVALRVDSLWLVIGGGTGAVLLHASRWVQ